MRLIDADELRHELIMGHDLVGAKYTDMADTVKAIPIEWIKEWWYENIKSANDGDDVAVDRMMKEWWEHNINTETFDDEWDKYVAFNWWFSKGERK